MSDPHRTNIDRRQTGRRNEIERLSDRVGTLERYLTNVPEAQAADALLLPTPPPDLVRMRISLKRARNTFKRLGNGSFALSGLTLAAFLKVLFDGNLSLLPAFIIITAALFLGIVGFLFHMQADNLDIGDADD